MASTKSHLTCFSSHLTSIQLLSVIAMITVASLIHATPTSNSNLDPSSRSMKFEVLRRHHPSLAAIFGLRHPLENANVTTNEEVAVNNERYHYIASRNATTVGEKDAIAQVGAHPYFLAYFMLVELGTPSQQFVTVMDTCSDLVWIPCAHNILGPIVPFLNPKNSSSYSTTPCKSPQCQVLNVENRLCNYGTCGFSYKGEYNMTLSGSFVTETLTLNGLDKMPQQFTEFLMGCALKSAHPLLGVGGYVGGYVGLGPGAISLPSQLTKHNIANIFSYCLVSSGTDPRITSPFIMGIAANFSESAGVKTTPLLKGGPILSSYFVNLEAITINGTMRVKIPSYARAASFEVGHTFTYITAVVYHHVRKAFLQAIRGIPRVTGRGTNMCFNTTTQPNYQFPSLVFHFKNADMKLPPTNYLMQGPWNVFCVTLYSSQAQKTNITRIGNLLQQNFRILFNNVDGLLSFVPQQCDQSSSSSSSSSSTN